MSETIWLKLIDAGGTLVATTLFIGLLRSTGVGLAAYLREYAASRRDGTQVLLVALRELCDSIRDAGDLLADVYRQSPSFDRRRADTHETFDPNHRVK